MALASEPGRHRFRVKREANVYPMVPAGRSSIHDMMEARRHETHASVLVENKPGS